MKDHESEVRNLFDSDQSDREQLASDPAKASEIRQRDEERLEKARGILANGNITNPHQLNMLAFVFLHGYTGVDYQIALKLATKAVEAGLEAKNSLIPQAIDKIMIEAQRTKGIPEHQLVQKLGTQVLINKEGTHFKPKLDGTAAKTEFAKYGIK